MLEIIYQTRFKKDARKYQHDKKSKAAVLEIIGLLQTGNPLPSKYKEHPLSGEYCDYLECHCLPDVLLIYQKNPTALKLFRMGSHSELFR
jgi:mRNA interferase YafQ